MLDWFTHAPNSFAFMAFVAFMAAIAAICNASPFPHPLDFPGSESVPYFASGKVAAAATTSRATSSTYIGMSIGNPRPRTSTVCSILRSMTIRFGDFFNSLLVHNL